MAEVSGIINNPNYPDPPACYSEAATVGKLLHDRVTRIMKVLESKGLSPFHFDEEWLIPFSEGEVCQMVTALMVDIQFIENLLIEAGLANETEFIPLGPRWRIDAKKHHARNWAIFETHVRDIIKAVAAGLPESKDIYEFLDRIKNI